LFRILERCATKAEDEKICRDLVAYVAQPPLSDDERAAHVKAVGKYLLAKGAKGWSAKPTNSYGGSGAT
jgi:hypothetical protein